MLETGVKAPDFTFSDQNGNSVSLSDFLGKKVVLYFYPKDNTPGCTRQACAFAGSYEMDIPLALEKLNRLIGIKTLLPKAVVSSMAGLNKFFSAYFIRDYRYHVLCYTVAHEWLWFGVVALTITDEATSFYSFFRSKMYCSPTTIFSDSNESTLTNST